MTLASKPSPSPRRRPSTAAPAGVADATTPVSRIGRGRGNAADQGYTEVQLGGVVVRARTLGVAEGRIALPKMMQEAARSDDAFLVRNANNVLAPDVLVINPAALDRQLREARPRRTVGDILDALPFKRNGLPRVGVRPLPDAQSPQRLRIRTPEPAPAAVDEMP